MSPVREPAPHGLAGEWIAFSDRPLLWQPVTGRGLRLDEEGLARTAAPSPPLRARLEALGFLGARDPGDWIPARSRWALLLPERRVLWHALPLERTAGGFPFAAMSLSELEVALWQACDGRRSVSAVAREAGCTVPEVLAATARWTAVDVQALQLRERPVRPREPALERLEAPPRPAHHRAQHHYGDQGQTTLDRYHGEQITDGATHFDDRETTLAHAFAVPHPALQGHTFGAALARRWAGDAPGPVLEIGPGTGELCAAFRTVRADDSYTRLDLSPELLATQEARCPGTRSLRGSATAIPLEAESVGLVLCNEVIADLEAAPDPGDRPIEAAPEQALFNTGAWAMVDEIARVLRPGGRAWVSEFGGPDELPVETRQLDHPEVSIHFGQLAAVARTHRLEVELLPVADALGLDRGARWLSRPSWEALRALARSEGRHLQARAWTTDTLDLPWAVEGLHEVPVTEPGAAPVVDRVWVALLRKP